MKKILLFFILLLFSVSGLAQNSVSPPFEVSDIKEVTKVPLECWQKYDSGKEHLTLKDIVSEKYSAKFEIVDKLKRKDVEDVDKVISSAVEISGLNNSAESWVRFRLVNTLNTPKKIVVFYRGENSWFYIYNKKWQLKRSGNYLPWTLRNDDVNNGGGVSVEIGPKEEIAIYIKSSSGTFGPKIQDYDQYLQERYLKQLVFDRDTIINFGFAGFVFFALVFNLFFYYINREKLYLHYSMLLFFIAMTLASETIVMLWIPSIAYYEIYIEIFLMSGTLVSFINTFQLFLNIRGYYPKWSRFFDFFKWCVFVLVLFFGFIWRFGAVKRLATNFDVVFIFVLLALIFLMFAVVILVAFFIIVIKTLIKLKKKKDPEAQLIFWALMPLVFANIFFMEYFLFVAMWSITLLSWGMFGRFKKLQTEYAAQAIEKERITREKEEEKNAIIAQQNVKLEQLVDERTAELEESIEHLKETQAQLIQSEKMASLGELTAGIAHEIQNPLNFVNNFSDVSVELLDEMEEELDKGDTDEVKAILGDVKQNLEKIAHHGRRADSIVKGMLQHSRASTGQKEPTDINMLVDEYLRLAYHGLRAKDKTFNAELITHLEPNLPKIEVVPQDIGRVFLNLFTNAFYATQQKSKKHLAEGNTYKPAVSVTTKMVDGSIEITVRDNGTGIPNNIRDKILQPFFTTKPTGEGTGLGLSLSYDIVVKAHGGTIDIDSVEGEYTEFIIRL